LLCAHLYTLPKVIFTEACSTTLANDQLDAQIFNTFITILYMYMFRGISCSSSGGQIVALFYPVHKTDPLLSTGHSEQYKLIALIFKLTSFKLLFYFHIIPLFGIFILISAAGKRDAST
jgi:hypothetical protein